MAMQEPPVRDVGPVLSMYIGPDEILVTLAVRFEAATPASELAATVQRLEHRIRERYPKVRRMYVEPAAA